MLFLDQISTYSIKKTLHSKEQKIGQREHFHYSEQKCTCDELLENRRLHLFHGTVELKKHWKFNNSQYLFNSRCILFTHQTTTQPKN